MDYKLLLIKYINHIADIEGTTYTSEKWKDEKLFTKEEWEELGKLNVLSFAKSKYIKER